MIRCNKFRNKLHNKLCNKSSKYVRINSATIVSKKVLKIVTSTINFGSKLEYFLTLNELTLLGLATSDSFFCYSEIITIVLKEL